MPTSNAFSNFGMAFRNADLPDSLTDAVKSLFSASEYEDLRENEGLMNHIFDKGIISIEFDSITAKQLEASWDFMVKREYGRPLSVRNWGLPQGYVWNLISSDTRSRLRKFNRSNTTKEEVRRIGADMSAIAPTNVTPSRLHDLTGGMSTYAQRRYRFIFEGLRKHFEEKHVDSVALQYAAILSNPTIIRTERHHKDFWVNYWPMNEYKGPDFEPIVVRVTYGRGLVPQTDTVII